MPTPEMQAPQIDHVVTSGTFSLDGQDFAVDNNIWIVTDVDRDGVWIIDAAHDAATILGAVGGRRVLGVVCTHGHNDHVNVAPDLADATGAPIYLHPEDLALWAMVHPSRRPDHELADGQMIGAMTVLHTPGHTPGGCCLHVETANTVFSGDTLFNGGPGATGRSFSDFPTIIDSIRSRLLVLPPATVVLTGHGDPTTIGAEAPHLDEWIARGH
ncbi:MAG: MBL fold metallo-hydrolase [Acidimicrobiales bacterium]